jgi:hypothetical protein
MPESWEGTHAATSHMNLYSAGLTKLLNESKKVYLEFKSSCIDREKVYRVFQKNFSNCVPLTFLS